MCSMMSTGCTVRSGSSSSSLIGVGPGFGGEWDGWRRLAIDARWQLFLPTLAAVNRPCGVTLYRATDSGTAGTTGFPRLYSVDDRAGMINKFLTPSRRSPLFLPETAQLT